MNCLQFLNMYDNWNGIVCINDGSLNPIVKGTPEHVLTHKDAGTSEVVAFGFYDNELCIRVKHIKKEERK